MKYFDIFKGADIDKALQEFGDTIGSENIINELNLIIKDLKSKGFKFTISNVAAYMFEHVKDIAVLPLINIRYNELSKYYSRKKDSRLIIDENYIYESCYDDIKMAIELYFWNKDNNKEDRLTKDYDTRTYNNMKLFRNSNFIHFFEITMRKNRNQGYWVSYKYKDFIYYFKSSIENTDLIIFMDDP
jgi:hypothetical protein